MTASIETIVRALVGWGMDARIAFHMAKIIKSLIPES